MRGKPLKSYVGEKYGYITIIDYGYREYSTGSKRRRGTLKFICECGNIKEVLAHNITQGSVKSCGCKTNEMKVNIKHGLWKHRLYSTYTDMKQRCLNSNNKRYHRYGGRGIKICDEWLNDISVFYEWAMNNGYEDNLTIERINNDGNYEPSNCTWITLSEQTKNRDTSNMGVKKK